MLFPIAIERGDDAHAFGVVVPDLPGCFSAGDTLDEALANVREAIDLHLAGLADDEQEIPSGSEVSAHVDNPDYAGFIWAVVDMDITRYLGKAEKVNVTLPGNLIRRIDAAVKAGAVSGQAGRSGYLAQAALEKLKREKVL